MPVIRWIVASRPGRRLPGSTDPERGCRASRSSSQSAKRSGVAGEAVWAVTEMPTASGSRCSGPISRPPGSRRRDSTPGGESVDEPAPALPAVPLLREGANIPAALAACSSGCQGPEVLEDLREKVLVLIASSPASQASPTADVRGTASREETSEAPGSRTPEEVASRSPRGRRWHLLQKLDLPGRHRLGRGADRGSCFSRPSATGRRRRAVPRNRPWPIRWSLPICSSV